MPQYRVLARSFIGNQLVEADSVVDYPGNPGSNLEPLDAAAEKRKAAYDKERGFAQPEAVEPTKIIARGGEDNLPDDTRYGQNVRQRAAKSDAKRGGAAKRRGRKPLSQAQRERSRPTARAAEIATEKQKATIDMPPAVTSTETIGD